MLTSGDCASKGMKMITNKNECRFAALLFKVGANGFDCNDPIVSRRRDPCDYPYYAEERNRYKDKPHGCSYKVYSDGSVALNWASPVSHPYDNIPCGSSLGNYYNNFGGENNFDRNNKYNCICIEGKILYH